MLEFVAALYNEEAEIADLIYHVKDHVDRIIFVDDGSTDGTINSIEYIAGKIPIPIIARTISHTGLPETVKREAVSLAQDDSWILMLDADERLEAGVLPAIRFFTNYNTPTNTHMWFTLNEFMDGQYAGRTFLKCRLFKKEAVVFSDTVHEDDTFKGEGINLGWKIIHRKTTSKQIKREKEYIQTYEKLLKEGKITEDRVKNLKAMHYFVKD